MMNILDEYINREKSMQPSPEMCSNIAEKAKARAQRERRKTRIRFFYSFGSIAAAAAIFLSVLIFNNKKEQTPLFLANVPMSEQEVLEMAQQSFSKLSSTIDETIAPLNKTDQKLGELKLIIGK